MVILKIMSPLLEKRSKAYFYSRKKQKADQYTFAGRLFYTFTQNKTTPGTSSKSMKNVILTVLVFIFLVGCSKIDTGLSRKLDGAWNITSAVAGSREYVGTEFEAFRYIFDDWGEGMGEMMGIVVFDSDTLRPDIDTFRLSYSVFFDENNTEYLVLTNPFERDTLEIQALTKTTFLLTQDFQDTSRNVRLVGEKE